MTLRGSGAELLAAVERHLSEFHPELRTRVTAAVDRDGSSDRAARPIDAPVHAPQGGTTRRPGSR